MRKITLREIIPPDNGALLTGNSLYRVFLGNHVVRYFANRKHAKKYLADTNRFLNTRLHELNFVYIYVLGEYRRAWFYFDSAEPGRRQSLITAERKILKNFELIDKSFEMAVRRSGTRGGNNITFQKLFVICEGLIDALRAIKTVMLERKYYAELQRLEMFAGQVADLRIKLEDYGGVPQGENPVTWQDPDNILD